MKNRECIAHYIASMAQRAVLYEVSATPKPGLVDRRDSGAHRDMDFYTFMDSSSAIYRGMYECALEGLNFKGEEASKLLDKIRPIGVECEGDMFRATKGINTHKGIIFSMGILCAAVGRLYGRWGKDRFTAEEVSNEVKVISKDLTKRDFQGLEDRQTLTHGERLYMKYGFKGIRGEVEGGFRTVMQSSIPILRSWNKKRDIDKNDLFLELLMAIMSICEDTNVVIRGGIESLDLVKRKAREFMNSGGIRQENSREKLERMNREFVERNISPGGAADLLAVTLFLGMIEGIEL